MKIKRYFAPDIRTAIRQVREQQGPDAVILSNKAVEGGVEIVAAVDYDEQTVLQQARSVEVDRVRRQDEPVAEKSFEELPERPRPAESIWSQEPVLTEMRRELNSMRDLLENQLSGLAWGDMVRNQPLRATLLRRLVNMGVSSRLAKSIADKTGSAGDQDQLWRKALGLLAHAVPVAEDDILAQGGIVALVGPTGVGKTTMVAKLAARFCLRHGRRQVALITTDNYRVGAHEQLRTYGRILDVPVRVIEEGENLGSVLEHYADRRLILIDTAGMGQRDARLNQHLAQLQDEFLPIRRYLVLSATTHRTGLAEIVRRFGKMPLHGCMLTKVDEATRLGGALSVLIEQQLPVAYVGDGQRVPEDLAPARAHNLVSMAVSMALQGDSVPAETASAHGLGSAVANGER